MDYGLRRLEFGESGGVGSSSLVGILKARNAVAVMDVVMDAVYVQGISSGDIDALLTEPAFIHG